MYNPGLRHAAEGELVAVGVIVRGNVVWDLAVHGAHSVRRLEAVRRRRRRRLRTAARALLQDAPDAAQPGQQLRVRLRSRRTCI